MLDPSTIFQNPEFRFEVALNTPIAELSNLCQTDVAFAEICRDPYFWRQKFAKDFPGEALYPGETPKSSYQIRSRMRPFGYYPDDEARLALLKLPALGGYGEIDLFEPAIRRYFSVPMTPDFVFREYENRDAYTAVNDGISILDIIIMSQNPVKFVSEFLLLLNLNRINITFAESIDLIFYALGSQESDYQSKPDDVSLLSSLNYDQLRDFLGPKYNGFPDYPGMMNAAITGYILPVIYSDALANPAIFPANFDPQRYAYIKSFGPEKIVRLWRTYRDEYGMGNYPPYLFVTCVHHPADAAFEATFLAMDQENYIEMLSNEGIRTDDNPTYDQGLVRMTMACSLRWVLNYDRALVLEQLGVPYNFIDPDIEWSMEYEAEILPVLENYLLVQNQE